MADDKSLSQDDIDALIAQVSGGTKPSPPAAAPALTSATAVTGGLDKDAIDALINQSQPVSRPQIKAVPAKASPANANPVSVADKAGALGQDDIDRLLSELSAASDGKTGVGSRTTLAATVATADIATARPSAAETLDAPAPGSSALRPSVPTTVAARASESQRQGTASNGPSLALSLDDLDALMEKQVGVTSDHGEAPMIDQSDIDALIKQLANATGAPDTKRISEALARHEGEIDQLLTGNADPRATVDAVDMPAARKASGGSTGAPVFVSAVPVMAPTELRGTRWLLAAAVLFLAMCATTLVLMVGAINGLQHELKAQHLAQLAPSDSFADDLKAALAQLATGDDGEVAKGVLFLQRLKARHPSHAGEIALALARNFHGRGLHRQAAEEYAILAESGAFDDPRVYLEYADALAHSRDLSGAIRQVYRLLASEQAYLGERDRRGLPRPTDEQARNRQALSDAYLSLGRLLSSSWDEQRGNARVASAATTPAPAKPAPADHGKGHHP